MYELRNGALKIAFPENGGGMPETITLLEADQTEVPVVTSGDYSFELELEDGTVLIPCAGEHFADEADGIKQIEFHHVKWETPKRRLSPDSSAHSVMNSTLTAPCSRTASSPPPGLLRRESAVLN